MLNQWLNHQTIRFCTHLTNWQQAIELSAQPLLENHTITRDYIDAIYQQHAQLGPYYVLAPGIAMPHARPEQGAHAQGLSLLLVKNGVNFQSSNHDPVYIIVMLAATDGNSHIEMISQLAEFFANQEDVDRVIAANSVDEIQRIIDNY